MYIHKSLNIVIPMAGLGSRFQAAGITTPKPLIKFKGKTMIEHVVENINIDARYTFIVQKLHVEEFAINKILRYMVPRCNIVELDGITEGAACSILYAKNIIDNYNPLLIVNSDNLIEWDTISTMRELEKHDGGVILTKASGPKWSYANINTDGFITEIAEKIEISDNATTGHYYWRRGSDFVKSAEEMIDKNIRYNNEFYIAPVYNMAIEKGLKIAPYFADKFWSVGTPEDLDFYLMNNI